MTGRPLTVAPRDRLGGGPARRAGSGSRPGPRRCARVSPQVTGWLAGAFAVWALAVAVLWWRRGSGPDAVPAWLRAAGVAVAAVPVSTFVVNLVPWWRGGSPAVLFLGGLAVVVALVTAVALRVGAARPARCAAGGRGAHPRRARRRRAHRVGAAARVGVRAEPGRRWPVLRPGQHQLRALRARRAGGRAVGGGVGALASGVGGARPRRAGRGARRRGAALARGRLRRAARAAARRAARHRHGRRGAAHLAPGAGRGRRGRCPGGAGRGGRLAPAGRLAHPPRRLRGVGGVGGGRCRRGAQARRRTSRTSARRPWSPSRWRRSSSSSSPGARAGARCPTARWCCAVRS